LVHRDTSTAQELKVPGARGERILTYEVSGDPHGWPIFLHHGMPGSSSGPKPRNSVLYRHAVKLISYNRPGYGRSDRVEGRTVADAAQDVKHLAQHLGFKQIAVMGRSGGGPHALACAALLPDLVTRAAVLVSFAPADAIGLNWYDNMVASNVDAYQDAMLDRPRLKERLRLRADRVRNDPAHLIELLRSEMTAADVRVVDDVAVRQLLLQTFEVGLVDGPYGWIDDVFALRQYWGFRPEAIRIPVRLWHGEDDRFAPAGHTRWLAERIPGATVEVQRGAAHFGALQAVPHLLSWLAEPASQRQFTS
jgi:pimeloyl-ACP methyl ester carboxylesterase